jgi:hypothetical protein
LLLPLPTGGQQTRVEEEPLGKEVLSRRLPALRLDQVTIARAFWEAINDAQVPGGIVSIRGRPEEQRATYAIPAGATLREALDLILAESPSLGWQIDDGVVDLFPPRALPEIFKVRIASYDFEDASNESLAIQELVQRPEVQQEARRLGLQPLLSFDSLTVYYPPGKKRPPQVPVHLRNISLLEAVNGLMHARGSGFWRYDEGSSDSERWFRIILGAGPPD